MPERLQLLDKTASFFNSLRTVRRIVAFERAPQLLSEVKLLWQHHPWKNESGQVKLGHYGTNIVETFFGQIRAKDVRIFTCFQNSKNNF